MTEETMNILCIIPARGGSKGIKNKNIIPLCGKPLIGYTIEAAFESKLVDRIVVSTDDEEIAKVASKYKVQIIKRPKKLAADSTPIEKALRHAVRHVEKNSGYVPEIVVWLQANVPVRRKGQIDEVIKRLMSSRADSAATMYPVNQYPQWMKIVDKNGFLSPLFPNARKYRRQDIKPMYLLDGTVVAVKRDVLMGTEATGGVHVFMGKKIVGLAEDRKYAVEVDDKEDLKMVEFYLDRKCNLSKG